MPASLGIRKPLTKGLARRAEQMTLAGTVVYFSPHGYGFVAADQQSTQNKRDFFVHIGDISNRRALRVGERVTFEVGIPTLNHPNRAVLVDVIDSGSAVRHES